MATSNLERIYRVSVDGAQAVRQLEKIGGSAASIDQRFAKFGANLRRLFAAGAVVAAVRTFARDMQQVVDKFDALAKASQSAGVTTEELSKLRYAAGLAGVEVNQLETSLRTLNVNLDAVANGSTAAGRRLAEMGITAGDDTVTAFNKIADSLAAMPDGYQKAAAAVEIFGRSGAKMIPLLNGGAEGLKEAGIEAEIFGQVIGVEAAKNAEIFNDNMSRLGMIGTGVMNQIAEAWLPTMASFTTAIVGAYKQTLSLSDALFIAFNLPTVRTLDEANQELVRMAVVIGDIEAKIERVRASNAKAAVLGAVGVDVEDLENALRIANVQYNLIEEQGKALVRQIENMGNAAQSLPPPPPSTPIKDAMTAWYEGLEKASEEMDRLNPKLVRLADEMDLLSAAGKENSSIFKVLSEEYEKLFAQAARDDVGTNIMLGLRKTKEEAALTAEKIAFLQQTIESMLAVGNTADAAILTKTMKELQGQTESVGATFEQVGDSISQAIAQNANNAVNSFIDSIGEAEISFSDFATAVLKDITKMILQLLVLKPLMDSISGYIGGFGSPQFVGSPAPAGRSLSYGGYSQPYDSAEMLGRNTGIVRATTEAMMPLARSTTGELRVMGAPVNVNVYNNAGTEVNTQESTGPDGTRQIDIYIERKMREGILNGSYDKAFRGAYGLSRMGA